MARLTNAFVNGVHHLRDAGSLILSGNCAL